MDWKDPTLLFFLSEELNPDEGMGTSAAGILVAGRGTGIGLDDPPLGKDALDPDATGGSW